MAEYHWKQVGVSFRVSNGDFPKCYGVVRRNGKVFYRNYKRPLKKGGLSFLDLYEKKMSDAFQNLASQFSEKVYCNADV